MLIYQHNSLTCWTDASCCSQLYYCCSGRHWPLPFGTFCFLESLEQHCVALRSLELEFEIAGSLTTFSANKIFSLFFFSWQVPRPMASILWVLLENMKYIVSVAAFKEVYV